MAQGGGNITMDRAKQIIEELVLKLQVQITIVILPIAPTECYMEFVTNYFIDKLSNKVQY